uniref:uncharacterized protein LOC120328366 n=1 Tax=Styela clava TaxID=7725 RepID=UPI001939AF59|nr:uncharacterized protein LOC120328366 [Styela clava]
MDSSLPEIIKNINETEELFKGFQDTEDPFGDYYYLPEHFNSSEFEFTPLCGLDVSRPNNLAAIILSTITSIVGIILNSGAIFLMTVLKEYKKSTQFWLFLQLLISNLIFLFFLFLQTINELNKRWIMGSVLCKLGEASMFSSHNAGVIFLLTCNIWEIVSRFTCKLPSIVERWNQNEIVEIAKKVLIFVCIWTPCALINLPLYKYNNLNDCDQCVLGFPFEAKELCPMLGLDISSCEDMMEFVDTIGSEEDDEPYVESESGDFYEFPVIDPKFDQILNLTSLEELTACKYEEPGSFFVWLLASFTLFYASPIPIMVFMGCFWIYDIIQRTQKGKNNAKNKNLTTPIILALNVTFFLCWTPWNVIHMKKAYGGIEGRNGKECSSLISYARFSALVYNVVAPVIYVSLTGKFRRRLVTSVTTSANFFSRLLNKKEKDWPEFNEITTTSVNDEEQGHENNKTEIAGQNKDMTLARKSPPQDTSV